MAGAGRSRGRQGDPARDRAAVRNLELIASENFVSEAVLEAVGSVMTNKYAEGYPGRRYYGGCENVDTVEELAIQRAKELFGAEHVNVQPHSGSQANMAAYFTVALARRHDRRARTCARRPPDAWATRSTSRASSTGSCRTASGARTSGSTSTRCATLCRGAPAEAPGDRGSALPASDRLRGRSARSPTRSGACMMADIAHPAGLVAAGSTRPRSRTPTSSPRPRTRRSGARAAAWSCAARANAQALDKVVMPGMQGGPLMHVIAAKAVAFREALTPDWRAYQRQIVANAKALADALMRRGYRLVTGGTDTHLDAGGPHGDGAHRQGGPGVAGPRLDHRQQEHDPVRDAEPDGHERDPGRHAGGHDTRA